jgi:hypothetical protein
MSRPFSELRTKLFESLGVLDIYTCYGKKVHIGKDLSVVVEGTKIDCEVESLEEARLYAKRYIETQKLLEDIDTTVPEEKVAYYIRKYHNVDKITDTLVESYIELASSNLFTVDPVVSAIKERTAVEFSGKFEYKLNDGNTVAINEDTQDTLNNLLQDKPEIVEYMRESKNNFMRIIKEVT